MDQYNDRSNGRSLNTTYAILKVVRTAGSIAAILICPILCIVFAQFINDVGRKKYGFFRVNQAASRLRERGLIKLIRNGGIPHYELTTAGEKTLAKFELREITINKPRKWDQKWRIIIFDIKETKKRQRDILRKCLKTLGFAWLQDSVWIYPYPCEQIIELARTAYGVRRDAIYLTCDRFSKDELLAFRFGLGLHPSGF